MRNLHDIGNIKTHCDWCGQSYQEDAETFMDIEVENGEHICPDCAGLAELITLAEGEAEPAENVEA